MRIYYKIRIHGREAQKPRNTPQIGMKSQTVGHILLAGSTTRKEHGTQRDLNQNLYIEQHTHLSPMNPTTRKLVAQGGQRVFTVALPKEWLAKHGLGKGDQVRITEQGDALLIEVSK
jgi:hypothetical protein